MDVSIIYVNYKTTKLIIESIQSVKQNTFNLKYEIIVVNNYFGESPDPIKKAFPETILLESPENVGFGKANNLGMEIAKGKCIFFLNPDTLLLNNAIKILYDFLISNPDAGACGGNLYDIHGEPNISYSRQYPSILQEILSIFYLSVPILRHAKSKHFNFTLSPLEVAHVIGADLMIKKEIIAKVGGFNPAFFMNFEETELCYRLKKYGYKIYSVPTARIIHLEGGADYIKKSRLHYLYEGQYIYFKLLYGYRYAENIYHITQLKNRIRIIQFSLLGWKKKIEYWKMKEKVNKEIFKEFRIKNK